MVKYIKSCPDVFIMVSGWQKMKETPQLNMTSTTEAEMSGYRIDHGLTAAWNNDFSKKIFLKEKKSQIFRRW